LTPALPTASKPRQVFALLLFNRDKIVATGVMMKELWERETPKTATTTLQTYVLQVRRHLAQALGLDAAEVARTVLRTSNGGYLLTLPAGTTTDLTEYRRLERAGIEAFQNDQNPMALRMFNRALSMWHGPALADVDHGHYLRAAVAGLEQSRSTLIEYRLEAELRIGHHRELLSELASLVVEQSYNENLHAQYMIALHRSGYRAKALEVYHRLRASMIEELGLEPSPKLRDLQRALLVAEPELDRPGSVAWQELRNPFQFEISRSY
jgi:DNA-binding SARP family transcriptional activator